MKYEDNKKKRELIYQKIKEISPQGVDHILADLMIREIK